jgi:hypothetical protein
MKNILCNASIAMEAGYNFLACYIQPFSVYMVVKYDNSFKRKTIYWDHWDILIQKDAEISWTTEGV